MSIGSTINGLKTLPRENIPPTTKIVRKAATEEDKEQVRDMWRNGLSAYKIAEQTGFAVPTIYNWCKGISSPNKNNCEKIDEETKEKAKSLYISGMAVARISEEIGVSKRSIFTWRNKYDWDKDKNKEDKEMVEQETICKETVEQTKSDQEKTGQAKAEQEKVEHKAAEQAKTKQTRDEQAKVEVSYPSPYKAFKVDDINICQKFLDKVTSEISDVYKALNGIDSFNAYKLGKMSVYVEMVKEVLSKED